MTERMTGWETTRLSKHFILLDFLADHEVYRSGRRLAFGKIWNGEHEALARAALYPQVRLNKFFSVLLRP